ncbi:MAG: SUMF1/EgtB/PvdO family nonheme iron enzyme [Planctomycetaceae bacterium]
MNSLSVEAPSAPALSFRGPYPGLRPFEEADAPRFFGRGAQSGQMLRRLEDHQFLAVIGSSGCGKSSLVYAGLLPALRQGWLLGALPHWKMLKLRPGEAPLDNLAAALYGEFKTPADPSSETHNPPVDGEAELGTALLRNTLSRGRYGLLDALRDAGLDDETNVLVLVDQFEELFRYREKIDAVGPAERERNRYQRHSEATEFVDLLLTAARQTHVPEEQRLPVYVVITMRSDFLGNCDLFQGLPEAINDSQFLTPRMTRDQLRDSIVGPLSLFNAGAEPELVGRILDDLGAEPDQLPLLQHALMRTWNIACQPPDAWQTCPIGLTLQHYLHSSVGGVAHALDNHANEIYAGLKEDHTQSREAVATGETPRSSPIPTLPQLLDWGLRRFGTSTDELRGRLADWLAAKPAAPEITPTNGGKPAAADAVAANNSSPAAGPTRDEQFENLLRRAFRPVLKDFGIGVPPPPNSAQWLCERMFRCLSAVNSTGQLVRRLATVREIAQVAGVTNAQGEPDIERVLSVARPFLAEGCSLLRASPDAQEQPLDGDTTLDISHEALLRQWNRCREWVDAERESERTWRRVLDEATLWQQGRAGFFPGASLVPIEEWRRREQPTEAWANRYPAEDGKPRASFQDAETFLRRSRKSANVLAALPYLIALAIFVAGVGFTWYRNREQQKRFVDRQVALLEGADTNQIERILAQPDLSEIRQRVFDRLWEDFQTTSDDNVKHNCALAILRLNTDPTTNLSMTPNNDLKLPPQTLEKARKHMVDAILKAGPDEILGWSRVRKPFAAQVAPQLWKEVEQTANRSNRLRAAAALAGINPPLDDADRKWKEIGHDLAQELITVSPLEFKAWSDNLRPVRQYLLLHLEQIYFGLRNEQRRSLTEAAVLVLADHWRDDPQRLVAWLLRADTVDEFQPFVAALAGLSKSKAEEATALLVSKAEGPWFAEQSINPTAQQQSEFDWKSCWREPLNASVCLVQLGRFERIRPLWLPAAKGTGTEQLVDPTFQSYLIARFQELGAIDPKALMLKVEELDVGAGDTAHDNNTIRQALLMVMGDFDSVRLPVTVRSELTTKLETLYRSTPDSGVRAAAGWVWQQWQRQNGEPDDLQPLNEPGQQTAGWFVNSQKQTFVVLPAPGQFEIGDLTRVNESEPRSRRTVEVPYSFALATTEVTRGDFLAFLDGADPQQFGLCLADRETLERLRERRGKAGFDPTLPISEISWYAATAYCNWLSQQDGLPESEWCYLPGRDPQGKDAETEVEYGPGMKLAAGCRTRRGYRLPTEEEWEYACRAGTTTQFGFGQPKESGLVARYAWTFVLSDIRLHRVADLRPNRRGLFDLHGNLWEWTMSLDDLELASREFDQNMTKRTVLSVEDESRVIRGGSFFNVPNVCRAASRGRSRPASIVDGGGFRVARAYSR